MAFLRNTWYMAMWGEQLAAGELTTRTILNEAIVLFRGDDGVAAALIDCCPHRFASFELGRVANGDRIRCPYHGLEFARSGECVHNPNETGKIPPARMRAYPVVERHSIIWIWMGDSEKADPSLVPDFSMLDPDADNQAAKRDFIKMKANYGLIIDNLLDLSHVSFLHEGILGNDETKAAKTKLATEGNRVRVEREMLNVTPPAMFDLLFKRDGKPVDLWASMRWDPPGCLVNDARVNTPGAPREEGTGVYGTHFLTPETERTTHYHFAAVRQNPRPFPPDIAEDIGRRIAELRRLAFEEQDAPIVEAQQRNIDAANGEDVKPVLFGVDVGSVAYRRVLDRLIAQER